MMNPTKKHPMHTTANQTPVANRAAKDVAAPAEIPTGLNTIALIVKDYDDVKLKAFRKEIVAEIKRREAMALENMPKVGAQVIINGKGAVIKQISKRDAFVEYVADKRLGKVNLKKIEVVG